MQRRSFAVGADKVRARHKVAARANERRALVALEAVGVVRPLVGLRVLRHDHLRARHALGVVLRLVVRLAEELAVVLGELGQRRVARRAHKARAVVLVAVHGAVAAAGDGLAARHAHVQRGEVTLVAVAEAGARLEEVVVHQLLVARAARPAVQVVVLPVRLQERLRLHNRTPAGEPVRISSACIECSCMWW